MELSNRLWARLYGTWGSPRRVSRMNGPGATRKYLDLDNNYSLTPAMVDDHLAGRDTYAATLGAAGTAWAGCKDYDAADEAEILAALAAAAVKGTIACAFLMPGAPGEHTGGHIWTFYDRDYPIADIRAQLRTIPRKGKGEDYPSGDPIRLPFGFHKVKGKRGTLALQDGRRFDLDTPEGLAAGLAAFFALPLNGKPKPAPAGEAHSNGQAFGEAYKPEEWKDLPDGGPIWRSPWIARCATTRPDLAKLLRGERVTLVRDDTPDDSDSAQVAALAFNLSSADVDVQQARAIADYLKPRLRPGRTIEHYRAHFDAEWERYKPDYYTGRVIRFLGPEEGETPQPLPAAEHKPPRKSRARSDRPQKVAGALGYLGWLRGQVDPQSDTVMLSQAQCAARLGCNVRTIKRYEQQLKGKIERQPFARRQAGCLFILVPDVVPTSPADVVIANTAIAQQDAQNAVPVAMQEEHPPPDTPTPEPAPVLAVAVRRAIVAIEQPAVDAETGEIKARFARATPDLVRGWITARWPDLDTTEVEEVYPEARKALQTERQREKQRAYWQAERARVRTLENESLLAALGGWASKLARAEGKQAGSPYARKCAAHFAIHDDERRRRGLSQVEAPRDWASRKAATERTVKLAQTLHRQPERPDRTSGAVQLGFGHIIADSTLAGLRERSERPVGTDRGASVPPLPAAAGGTLSSLLEGIQRYHAARTAAGGD